MYATSCTHRIEERLQIRRKTTLQLMIIRCWHLTASLAFSIFLSFCQFENITKTNRKRCAFIKHKTTKNCLADALARTRWSCVAGISQQGAEVAEKETLQASGERRGREGVFL